MNTREDNVPRPARSEAEGLMRTVVDGGFCIGCGACAVASGGVLEMEMDSWQMYRPRFSERAGGTLTTPLAAICPFSGSARTESELAEEIFPQAARQHSAIGRWCQSYVGWVEEADLRAKGSSGGFVTWVLTEYLRRGLVDGVAHVGPHVPTADEPALFNFTVSRSEDEIRRRSKSRYYPIELSQVLEEIRTVPGRYAVVGIPCYVKAMRLLMRTDPVLQERVVLCVALFCGHLKSAAMVDSFALQAGVEPRQVAAANFRLKQPERRADTYTMEFRTHDQRVISRDWWRMVDGNWGLGFFQYSACNFCDDVTGELADISCGDAWVQPYSSDGRGTNVVVVRTPEAQQIIEEGMRCGALALTPVDGDFVASTQVAGLRQRREGLAYRLWKCRGQWLPRKRVAPDGKVATWWRRRIYDFRWLTSRNSHRVFLWARRRRKFKYYLLWARGVRKVHRLLHKFAGEAPRTPPATPLIASPTVHD